MRRTMAFVFILLACSVAGFGAETKSEVIPWMASYNQSGQLNGYASAGYYGWGIAGSLGAELVVGEFDIAGVPFSWGVMARGVLGFPIFEGLPGIDWAGSGLATLHWGLDFGPLARFELYFGLGAGVFGNYWEPFNIGISECSGVNWFLTDNLTLVLEGNYLNGFASDNSWFSYLGAGVQIKL
jgi:hypothetical protein